MSVIKSKYEISIWDDIFSLDENNVQYLDEQFLATIGSDTMTSMARAISPQFRENINGTKQLIFTLYTNYLDEETGKKVTNPFIKLLVNERKIKLKEGGKLVSGVWKEAKWHDLVITDIQENSSDNSFTYTATDLHINELAKNGFNLEFDNELENNQGTVDELAEKILAGTDWKVGKSDQLKQYKTEPVYLAVTKSQIQLVNLLNDTDIVTVPAAGKIYTFYTAKDKQNFQCIFNKDFSEIKTTESLTKEQYQTYKLINESDYENITINKGVESFQAERLVSSAKSGYDAKIDKYYTVYGLGDKQYNCFTKTEFISPKTVSELMVDGKEFAGSGGWYSNSSSGVFYDNIVLPEVTPENIKQETEFIPYLKVTFPNNNEILYNTAINVNRSIIKNFLVGEKYHIILKGLKNNQPLGINDIKAYIYKNSEKILDFGTPIIKEGSLFFTGEIKENITYKELMTGAYSLGFTSTKGTIYLSKASFFKEVLKANGEIILPEEILDVTESYNKTYYYLYDPTSEYTNLDDIKYVYVGTEIPNGYNELSNDFTKVRSIAAKETNRYNLIQTLAETFECWAKFEIEHEENGKIKLDNNNKQIKYISFHNYINDDYNYAGFKKGINLTSTNRSLVSDQIVSKLIVKNNTNEFATDGFCSIARAEENYIKENLVYNFDYYISHNLIDGGQLFADLYNPPGVAGALGYYSGLREINLKEDPLIDKLSEIDVTLTNLEAQLQTATLAYDSAEENLASKVAELHNYFGISDYTSVSSDNALWKNEYFLEDVTQIKLFEQSKKSYEKVKNETELKIKGFEEEKSNLNEQLKVFVEQKEELNSKFFSKYSRFIKEGTWISEDYYDDNLYYLDAEKVLQESAYPKVTYTIQVIDLSQLEEFKNYTFSLGEKSFIEDTDFFGWNIVNGKLTPAKEEIIISEITRFFEEPEKNIITVQNYKARFEELFQRITATTQSLQLHSGEYGRAANVVESNGEIKYETLQNSISNNAIIVQNAKDQSVIFGDSGITVTNLAKPNEIVRIVSGGLLISNDGGQSYQSAIRGTGINASYITAGQINAEKINIIAGSYPSFKWDRRGINAFWFLENQEYGVTEFNLNKFVRFDRFGLYGCLSGEGGDFNPKSLKEVKDNANFGLTWDGFFLKSKSTENGGIEITTENDIRVIENNIIRVEIGLLDRLANESSKYGLRLRNNSGKITLETSDEGSLWLKDRLNVEVFNINNNVGIGTLDTIDDEHGREVINATDKFIVYEDGHMKATSGEFTGTIHATGGEIGGMTIDQWSEVGYTVQIDANKTVIKNEQETIRLVAKLFRGSIEVTENLTYQWLRDKVELNGETNKDLIVSGQDFSVDNVRLYSCRINYN